MSISYVKGDILAILDNTKERVFVPHIVNDDNRMGSGIAKVFADKWPDVKKFYHWWFQRYPKVDMIGTTGKAKLGQCQYIDVTDNITVVNMVAQSDPGGISFGNYHLPPVHLPPIRYQSLEECMLRTVEEMKKTERSKIITVKFGSERAGGDWDTIVSLIHKHWSENGIEVIIVERKE